MTRAENRPREQGEVRETTAVASHISNRNTTAFKNRCNAMKTQRKTISNRNISPLLGFGDRCAKLLERTRQIFSNRPCVARFDLVALHHELHFPVAQQRNRRR
jgi:hypothetical protein